MEKKHAIADRVTEPTGKPFHRSLSGRDAGEEIAGSMSHAVKDTGRKKSPRVPIVHPANFFGAAFSLIELMVAMTVLSLLLVLLLNMVNSGIVLWRTNENRVDSYREARAALGVLSRDLQNAVADTNATFLFNAPAFANLPDVENLVVNTNQGAAVFFLTSLPTRAQDIASNKSDVCLVGYFLAFGKSSSAGNSPVNTLNIYRYMLSSDPTFIRLGSSPLAPFPSTLTTSDARVELLARNVTRFTASAHTFTNNGLVPFSASADTPIPDLVEIRISAINQEAGKKLGNSASDFSAWLSTHGAIHSNIIAPVEQTFTTRITPNRPR